MRTPPFAPSEDQQAQLSAWRAVALERMPYLATTLLSLRYLDAPGLGTFAVDDRMRCYIDFAAVSVYGVDWCAEALLHECGHVFGRHAERMAEAGLTDAEKAAKLGNLAADCEVNDDLVAAGCSSIAGQSPNGPGGVLPSHFGLDDHQTAEEYLDELRKQAQSAPAQAGGSGGGPNSRPSPEGDGGEPYAGCGSGAGAEAAPCELPDGDDAKGAAPAASDAEKARVRIATAVAVTAAAAKAPGSVPAGLLATAKAALEPSKVPWRAVLASSIRRAVASRLGDADVTYSRRNRRRPSTLLASGRAVVNPGVVSPLPSLAVVRDTSGSMSDDELGKVSVEIEAIARQIGIRGDDLRVLDVDAATHAVRAYRGPASLEEVTGRGGTDMGAGIADAVALRPTPTAVIVVTDGFTPWPAVRPRVPVVVCLVAAGKVSPESGVVESVPAWARLVVVEGD